MEDIINNIEKNWFETGHLNINQRNYLIELLTELKPKNCLEIGFASGRSLVTIYFSCKPERLLSIDIDLDYIKGAREFIEKLKKEFNNVFVLERDSTKINFNILNKNYFMNKGVDFAFIDGGHTYEICMLDLNNVYKISHKGTVILIDDYKSSFPDGYFLPEVTNAVDDFIKKYDLILSTWYMNGKGFAKITI